ncbi:MAG: FtsX-like permease family protein [Segetibacter sp.]
MWRSIYFYKLQPLSDIHLRSNLQNEIAPTGSISQVYIFSIIGIFILLLAGINYTNLSTARSAGKAKEVGIKKVAGASKKQLMLQYLFRIGVHCNHCIIAVIFTFTFAAAIFFQVTGKNLSLFSSPMLVFFLLGVTIFLGVLSGIYPAIILSAFNPAGVLKGSFKSSDKGVLLRKTLVVSQFVTTIILITGIVIIYAQMSFIKHKDLGYNKDALLLLRVNGNTDVINGYGAFKNDLENSPLISGIATSNSSITGGLSTGGSETVDIKGNPLQVNTSRLRVDTDYFNVYGIKLLAGRNFPRNSSADTIRQIILNERAVKNSDGKILKPQLVSLLKGVIRKG